MEVMTTATMWRITIREMIDLNRIKRLFLGDEVSDSTNGMNLDLGAKLRKLPAQAVNVIRERPATRCSPVIRAEQVAAGPPRFGALARSSSN